MALALALAGCSAGAGTEGASPAAGAETLTVGLTAEPTSLDFTTSDGAAIPEALLYNVVETLVKVDAATGDVVPLLAESYEVSADGTEYAFTLHDGVTFSNGDAFTAEDVAFSIERVQSPAWTVSLKAAMDVVDEVEVVSPTEVVVRLARPDDDWLYRMTTRVGAMFSETGVDDLANSPIGTGPYTVTGPHPRRLAVDAGRDDYWAEQPDVERVVLRYFEDAPRSRTPWSAAASTSSAPADPESLEPLPGRRPLPGGGGDDQRRARAVHDAPGHRCRTGRCARRCCTRWTARPCSTPPTAGRAS
jgi:peptide/nickel transport system substrate-binding protein